MAETPPDAASLTILAGPHKGQRLVLDDAVDDVLIGSDPDCRMCIEMDGVSPIHARLWLDPEGAILYDTRSAAGVYVNDDRVNERAPLRDGDIIWLGAPAEHGSAMLQFRHPGASAAVPPAPALAEPEMVVEAEDPEMLVADPDPVAELEAETEVAPDVEAEPAAAAAAEQDEWMIDESAQPAAEEVAAPPDDPLESMLEDDAGWPPPGAQPIAAAPPPPPPPPSFARPAVAPSAPAPALEDDFFVEEPAATAEPEPVPAPEMDEDMFEWGGAASAPATAPSPAPVYSEPEPEMDPMLSDWSTSPPPPPAAAYEPQPEPAPLAPTEDDDVFYVESPEPPPPPPAPPPRPVAAAAPAPEPPAPPMAAAPPPPPAARPAPPAPPVEPAPAAPPAVRARHAPSAEPASPRSMAPSPRPSARKSGGSKRLLLLAGGAVVALGIAGLIAMQLLGAPRVDSVEPTRVRGGDTLVVLGRNFSSDAAGVVVRFEGQREGRILRASATRLEVEVPAIPAAAGRVNRVPVVVSVRGRESKPVEIAVYQAPRIHGIAPTVAQAGDEVTLAGTDWGAGATVQFGGTPAPIIELSPTSIRVRVPATNQPDGTRLPVVVSMGGDPSNELPFFLGRLPLLLSVEPKTVRPGDPLVIKGMGFAAQPSANDLRVGGVRAVVVKASDGEILALVPRTPADGPNAVELRVPASDRTGQSTLTVAPPADPVEFHFVVEHPSSVGINDPENGHDHVVLSTGLGPAFLISAADGVSAAERAAEAQRRLNEAAVALKAALTTDLEVRGLDGQPSIGLVGKQEPLLVVTADDAAAYDEDWARGKGKGEDVSSARLAIWWNAVARDLVLMLVRGEKPRYAAALAPEGRTLGTLSDAARRTGQFGVPREAVTSAPPALRQALRGLAFRVPAAVKAPSEASTAAPPVQSLTVDGIWTGSETESGATRYMTVNFAGGGGTFTYERALSVTIPLTSVEQPSRRQLKFAFRSGIHLREYAGAWDGQKLRGKITGEDGAEIGAFELERKR
jgi:hypothetical protein